VAIVNAGTFTSTITVSGVNTYLLDLDMTTDIRHTANLDLDITLTSPAGTVVTITTDNGGFNDDVFDGTLWDDDGGVPVTDAIYADGVTATPLVPEEAMGAFIGENPNGDWTLTIVDDAAGDSGSLDQWDLYVTTITSSPTTTASNFTVSPGLIIDGSSTVTSTINVSGLDTYLLDLDLTTFIPHTYGNDLDFTLTSPSGTIVTISTDNGGAYLANVFNGTLWDDDGGVPVTDAVYADGVVETPLVPEEAMGAFIGENPNGTWTLTIDDDHAPADDGTLDRWDLDIDTGTCDSTAPFVSSHNLSPVIYGTLTQIRVTFSEDVYDPTGDGDSNDVTNPANYLLVEEGVNTAFDTTSCSGGWTADDVLFTTGPVTYNNGTFTALVTINGGTQLPEGFYRFFVCGTTSIQDLAGNTLGGGEDFIYDFRISTTAARALPDTGFAPAFITRLPTQPAEKAYANLGDLWMEIPKLGVSMPILGVPVINGEWDVAWLGSNAGYLEGTAFPTLPGNTGITAHVWDNNNNPGPFLHLRKLQYSDVVRIHFYGQVYTYSVRYNYLTHPANMNPLTHEEYDWVTLLTCERYSSSYDSYRFRRVVRAVLVEISPE
jgi:LPXTG-site transpeptidase (sortase) family protein